MWHRSMRTHPRLPRNSDLPLQQIHGAIRGFSRLGVKSLRRVWSQISLVRAGVSTHEWVILAPLFALLSKTRSANSRHCTKGMQEDANGFRE